MKTHHSQKPRRTLFASALLALLAWLAPLAANASPLGTAFTYQGLLTENGNPINGSYDLLFNLYSTEIGGSPVTTSQVKPGVPVVNGLFTTNVDFGAVYDGTAYWLEIGARPNGSAANFQIMTPRQELTLSPYTIFATTAGGVAGGAVRSLNGLSDSVTLSAGANVSITPSGNTLTIASTGGGGGIWALNGSSAYYNGGRVGIGTSTPQSALHISGVPDAVRLTGSHPFLTLDDTALGLYSRIQADGAGMTFKTQGAVTGSNPGGLLHLDGVGYVGIGTTTPSAKLQVVTTDAGIDAVSATSATGKGVYGLSLSAAPTSAGVWGENPIPGGTAVVGKSLSTLTGTGIYGESASLGGIGVYGANTAGGQAGHFAGDVGITGNQSFGNTIRQMINLYDITYGIGVQNNAEYFRTDGEFLWYRGGSHSPNIGDPANGTQLMRLGNSGTLIVSGMVQTPVLEITGGADVAEPFKMTGEQIEKGAVVIIDAAHPGQLKLSERAYDTRVAGIVSGANGIKPGISQWSGICSGRRLQWSDQTRRFTHHVIHGGSRHESDRPRQSPRGHPRQGHERAEGRQGDGTGASHVAVTADPLRKSQTA
jgi:hypothetical protein